MEEDGIENNFPATYRTRETADLFMALIIKLLKNHGRAAVVLPDGFLFGEGMKTRLKEDLLEKCNLHTIVRLPNGVFNPYTGIKTNILFFTKKPESEQPGTEHVWFYEHPYPEGVNSYNKTKPMRFEEFADRDRLVGRRGRRLQSRARRPSRPGKSASTTSRPATTTSTSKTPTSAKQSATTPRNCSPTTATAGRNPGSARPVENHSQRSPQSMKKKATKLPKHSDFESLVTSIVQIHEQAQEFASKAVNIGLTLRNWLIGRQIEVYERDGVDRADYGSKLMNTLAARLQKQGWARCDRRELYRFRQFYLVYPSIVETLTPQSLIPLELKPLLAILPGAEKPKRESVSPESQIVETLTPQLIHRLSFSHLAELIELSDETQRRFYEIECIRGNWSVRELRRQIDSLYYQRSGLSKNKANLSTAAHTKAETLQPAQIIRDPYIFEFLGLRSRDVMGESDLEDALLDRLQDFLLEMGHGFCLEARQKRILIGDEHFFVDLVFYHRILKCHVLVELKTTAFSHEHLGQLNTYVAYYKKHEMTPGDQPPVGILLCTRKNKALVKFALGDMTNQLFVSRYAVEMPAKQEMENFLKQIGKELTDSLEKEEHA